MITGPQDILVINKKGRNAIIAIKIAEPVDDLMNGEERLEKEIERFQKGVATCYNAGLEILSTEPDGKVKMKMFFGEAKMAINGELGPDALADFLDGINNGFDYRGDPRDSIYDPLGVIGFAYGVKQNIWDMNIRIKREIISLDGAALKEIVK